MYYKRYIQLKMSNELQDKQIKINNSPKNNSNVQLVKSFEKPIELNHLNCILEYFKNFKDSVFVLNYSKIEFNHHNILEYFKNSEFELHHSNNIHILEWFNIEKFCIFSFCFGLFLKVIKKN